jgi:hypothetical protein
MGTDGRMDGLMDGRMDGRMDGWTYGHMDRQMDGWTDKVSYRGAMLAHKTSSLEIILE